MTIYIRMLPSSLKHDDTTWRMVDDSWWSIPFYLKFSLFGYPHSYELLVSYIAPLSFSSFCHAIFLLFDLVILLDLPPHSLFYASNLDLFPWMISFESRRWGHRWLYVLLLSTFLDLHWFLIDERLFIGAAESISSIHNEWVMSSLRKVIGVHHVPCFIYDWIHLMTYPNWIESFL